LAKREKCLRITEHFDWLSFEAEKLLQKQGGKEGFSTLPVPIKMNFEAESYCKM
jgi:hypothetical protein